MPEFSALLQQGAANAWLFIPSAILLGALHGLEPGHSKTMMAAFIVAIRGTVGQAVMLGLAATLSHTAVVWAVALGGMWIGRGWNAETTEPYFQLASAVLIVAVALWMAARTWREQRHEAAGHDHHHHHGHDHDHHGHAHHHHGQSHGGHSHATAGAPRALDLGQSDYQDAHERAHARDIQRRFAGRHVTTGQILLFGLTGGLIPCPAAITVLLLCLQLKEVTLGAALVVCFSIGLALTLVAAGAVAALGMRHAERRWSDAFGKFARRAPYLSSAVITLVGIYVGVHALQGLGLTLAWIGGPHLS
ncbi:nickel/cobalt efflux transporter [Azospirillum sp. Sh1]|uniref:nickel/cobalt efflux transporter n=1 Tax=Azospirillum sp. Sh1 TaxID=2607285 RepID=UPI0011EEC50E|nr:nickel/cobalt efflux transporter [Azospirillum sp. Sh1]KAA0579897.1 nickel/cobalt efflux transporter RcnA [Azospirillum sp. Sh1]